MIEQIFVWQVLQQLVQALEGPLAAELSQTMFDQFPTLASPPAELVEGVIRGYLGKDVAFKEARKSGYDREPFQLMLDITGEPPPPGTLLELWRRKVIPEKGTGADMVSVEQGIREGHTKNKWIEPLKALKTALPSPEMALQALLQGQTEKPNAQDLYEQWGGDPRYFDLMFETRGSAPSPLEAASMAHRGIIPWAGRGPDVVSFEQAFLEGPWRNKWLDPMRGLSEYLPPPRTVTALLREGVINDAQAATLFQKQGLSVELAAAYVKSAHHQKTAASKDLTKADAIAAYMDGLLPRDGLATVLAHLGWSAAAATLEIEMADFRKLKALISSAVTLIRGKYVARKITRQTVTDALAKLGVSTAGVSQYLAVWDVERQQTVLRLTPAQWAKAVKQGWITAAQGLSQLQGMGYTPFEAWVLLADALNDNKFAPQPPADIPAAYTATA